MATAPLTTKQLRFFDAVLRPSRRDAERLHAHGALQSRQKTPERRLGRRGPTQAYQFHSREYDFQGLL